MTVAQSTVLRQQMRDAGADFRVTKNRLAKIALDGTSYTGIGELLTGPTALATSTDPVSAAKIAVEFAKTNDCKIIASCPVVEAYIERHPEYQEIVHPV